MTLGKRGSSVSAEAWNECIALPVGRDIIIEYEDLTGLLFFFLNWRGRKGERETYRGMCVCRIRTFSSL